MHRNIKRSLVAVLVVAAGALLVCMAVKAYRIDRIALRQAHRPYWVVTITSECDGCIHSGSSRAIIMIDPTATVSGSARICLGASTTITATLTGRSPFTITWSDGMVQTVASETVASRTVTPSRTTTYSIITVADANSDARGTGSATVSVMPLPEITITASPNLFKGVPNTIPVHGPNRRLATTCSDGSTVPPCRTGMYILYHLDPSGKFILSTEAVPATKWPYPPATPRAH